VEQYVLIGILMAVGIIFPLGAIMTSWAFTFVKLRPSKPDPIKLAPYECGFDPIGPAWIQFNFRYYAYALIFLIFGVEVIFLYPWAVHFNQLGLFGLIEMVIFIAILAIGLAYAWRKGALEWD
jgi:NADH-quinone oxidoreductase subunit A